MKTDYKKWMFGLLVFFGIFFIHTGFSENLLTLEEAAKEAKVQHLSFPKPEVDGRVQTLNRKGGMSPEIDRVTQLFLEDIQGKKALEIGVSYSNVLIEALKKKTSEYVANDLDIRHLQIAALRIEEKIKVGELTPESAKRVLFLPGSYPAGVQLADNSFDSILIARVLHFLSPMELEAAIKKSYRLLKPGGKIYVVAITPFVKRYEPFIPEYERRLAAGDSYPGYVESLLPYLHANTSEKERKVVSPDPFLFLDARVLKTAFAKEGFNVLFADEFPLAYQSSVWSLDGRENVGLVAEKQKLPAQGE